MNLVEAFWVKYLPMYPKVGEEALHLIIPFATTYLCESGFVTLTVLKRKQRNLLALETNFRCALLSLKLKISELVIEIQYHPSH
jgi:hypothetical protein